MNIQGAIEKSGCEYIKFLGWIKTDLFKHLEGQPQKVAIVSFEERAILFFPDPDYRFGDAGFIIDGIQYKIPCICWSCVHGHDNPDKKNKQMRDLYDKVLAIMKKEKIRIFTAEYNESVGNPEYPFNSHYEDYTYDHLYDGRPLAVIKEKKIIKLHRLIENEIVCISNKRFSCDKFGDLFEEGKRMHEDLRKHYVEKYLGKRFTQ